MLAGQAVAAVFEKPSARTRVSFEVAVATLGGHCVTLRGEELGLGSRESVADVARTLASYCTMVGARVFDHRVLEEMARIGGIPVVNLLSDTAHPGQAVGDLLTLEEHLGGPVEGRRLVFVGDGNNVAASLALAAALTGLEMVVSSPPGYELDDAVVERARNLGGVVELVADPFEAVGGRRRRLHRRVDVDGPGGRERGPPGRLRRLPGQRRAHGRRPARHARAPLPPGQAGPRDHRRGDRRAQLRGVDRRPRTGCTPTGRSSSS